MPRRYFNSETYTLCFIRWRAAFWMKFVPRLYLFIMYLIEFFFRMLKKDIINCFYRWIKYIYFLFKIS